MSDKEKMIELDRGVIFSPEINKNEVKIEEIVQENINNIKKDITNEKFVTHPDINPSVTELEKKLTDSPPTEPPIVTEEPKELTEEEKKELFIKQLKESKIRFKPVKHIGTKTINQFNKSYKKKRKNKNKIQKKSRKNNR